MTKPPKVSVVIPAFNAARWLGESIGSVLEQTWSDFELIVVDDGSTDGTAELAESFRDSRLRCLRQTNRGLSGARNAGVRAAAGELVAFLDADDRFHADKLTLEVAAFQDDPGLGLTTCGYELIDESGRHLGAERLWLAAPVIDLRQILFWNPILVGSAMMVRRDLLLQVGLFDEKLRRYEDWDLALRLALAGCRMTWIREVLASYRRHEQNMSTAPELVPVATEAAVGFIAQFFQRPEVPEDIRVLKREVFGNLYLDAAARAFGSGLGEFGREWLATAVAHDPGLRQGYPPRWVVALCGHALGTLVDDWRSFLECAAKHLPAAPDFGGWSLQRLTAHLHASRAFRFKRAGRRTPARLAAARALAGDPRLLSNKGLVSIGLKPW